MKLLTDKELNFVGQSYPYFIYKRLKLESSTAYYYEKISNGFGYLLRKLAIKYNHYYDDSNSNSLNYPPLIQIKHMVTNKKLIIGGGSAYEKLQGADVTCLCPNSQPIIKKLKALQKQGLVSDFSLDSSFASSTNNDANPISMQYGSRKVLNFFYPKGDTIAIELSRNPLDKSNNPIWIDFFIEGVYIPRTGL